MRRTSASSGATLAAASHRRGRNVTWDGPACITALLSREEPASGRIGGEYGREQRRNQESCGLWRGGEEMAYGATMAQLDSVVTVTEWVGRARLLAEQFAETAAHFDRTAEFPFENFKALRAAG